MMTINLSVGLIYPMKFTVVTAIIALLAIFMTNFGLDPFATE